MYISNILVFTASVPAVFAVVRPNNVGKLPALGWSAWNAYHCDIDATKILKAANAIVDLGLKDVGYTYVNIDDCWAVQKGRDTKTQKMIPDPVRFPKGISGVANSVHALGLKFGLYSDAGTQTCAEYPGSLDYEEIDAKTFSDWGVDYLKYDNCHIPSRLADQYNACEADTFNYGNYGNHPNGTCPGLRKPAPKGYDWSTSNTAKRYRAMANALVKQKRVILFSICNHGHAAVESWGATMAASWRSTNDIIPYWYRVAQILNDCSFKLNSVDFWGHNDMDMLEIGNGNLTLAETRSHFAFWIAAKSPIILGTDITKLSKKHLKVIKNKDLINFNQDDKYGKPATPFKWGVNKNWTYDPKHPAEYWSGPSKAGTLVLMLNSEGKKAVRKVTWDQVPKLKAGGYEVKNLWSGNKLGCVSGIEATLDTHDTAALLVGGPCSHTKGIFKLSSSSFD